MALISVHRLLVLSGVQRLAQFIDVSATPRARHRDLHPQVVRARDMGAYPFFPFTLGLFDLLRVATVLAKDRPDRLHSAIDDLQQTVVVY
jgi:hypothetical protein